MGKESIKNKRNKFTYPIAVLGMTTMLMMGAGATYVVGADEFDVVHTDVEEEKLVDNKEELPKLHYLVVGGEPRDIEYSIEDIEGKLSYYINTTGEEYEIEGLKDVSDGELDVMFEEVSEGFKVNSILDYGNIGFHGEGHFVLDSEDLIGLKPEGKVTEHIAQYNEETETYEILAQRAGVMPIEELEMEDEDIALITFIEFDEEDKKESKEVEGEEKETDKESEETKESKESKETDGNKESEEPKEDESKDTDDDKESEEEKEEESKDTDDDKGEKEEDVEEDTESESKVEDEKDDNVKKESKEEYSEVDTSKKGGNDTFMGDILEIGVLKDEETDEELTVIYANPMQTTALMEDIGKPLSETRIYSENGIETAQDLYDKFGLYNIPKELEELYREELDENGDGIMGNAPGKEILTGIVLGKPDVSDPESEKGIGELDEEDIEESDATPDDFDINEDLPSDWEEGSQDVGGEDSTTGDTTVDYPDWFDPESGEENPDLDYIEEGVVAIPDDYEYEEELPEEEVDDTDETDDENPPEEEEDNNSIIDIIIGGGDKEEDKEEEGSETPTEEDNIKDTVEDGDVDDSNTEEDGENTEDIIIDEDGNPVEEDGAEDSEEGDTEGSEPELPKEDVVTGDIIEESTGDEGGESKELEREPTIEEGTDGSSNEKDNSFKPDTSKYPNKVVNSEDLIGDSNGVSKVDGQEVIIEIDEEGNIVTIRKSDGSLVLAENDTTKRLELVDAQGIGGVTDPKDIQEAINGEGITLMSNEDIESEVLEELPTNDEIKELMSEGMGKDMNAPEELPDTGVTTGIDGLIPLALSLIVIGGIGVYVNRRKVK